MPTTKEWENSYSDLMATLRLPCKLRFSSNVKIGAHEFEDDGSCWITVNPEVDFRVPEHLILHEAAHHTAAKNLLTHDDDDDGFIDLRCCMGPFGHCQHWAKVLCGMYAETETQLPQTTSFTEFASAAGIERKNFVPE